MNDVELIKLSRGLFAIVDSEDFERVAQHTWSASIQPNNVYARTTIILDNGYRSNLAMHSFILCTDEQIDHINRLGLDNRKRNLRIATTQENVANSRKHAHYRGGPTSSKYRGVSWHKQLKKWHAKIVFNGKKESLGVHEIEEDAARAYNFRAAELFGEFAYLNDVTPLFPKTG